MSLPWVIGVLSTDYDLHDYREAIINCLKKEENIVVSAFESPNFPIEPDKHSHDVCLTALKRTHIVVLVIDKRYGGIYYDSADVSITKEEYLSAIENEIPCLVFVNKQAWDERHAYNVDLKKSGMAPQEFKKEYNCKYVNDIETIYFINEIQDAYEKRKRSNWINFFDSISDLLDRLQGNLKGLSRFWIKQIVNKQKESLKARKTSTGLSMSLGDVFEKGYYMKPEYSVESGSLS